MAEEEEAEVETLKELIETLLQKIGELEQPASNSDDEFMALSSR
jgi:hypothetical protein